jgi:Protein of unknown function (DUF2849)
MSKSAPTISVLTANRLSDGAVVFLDFDGVWVESLRGAVVARSPDEVRALESRGAFAARNMVVEPYLVEMHEAADGNLTPVRFRERVRLGGPSILDDVPGYVEAAPVVRQAHHEGAKGGHLAQPRSEPVEGRAVGSHAEAA